jgi:hypothetical protein
LVVRERLFFLIFIENKKPKRESFIAFKAYPASDGITAHVTRKVVNSMIG